VDAAAVPDSTLVERTVAGDVAAFGELYRRHVTGVRRIVAEIVSDRETAADLTHDVFAQAIEALAHLRQPDRFRPWLMTIARNCALDHVRGPRRAAVLDEDAVDGLADTAPSPAELAELAGLAQLVRGCIAGLAARDAAVLAVVIGLGYSSAEVAVAFAITPGAAKVVLHRARRRLRSALALTLLAGNAAACDTFRQEYAEGRMARAGEHVAACSVCRTAVNDEVELFAVA
jgi:RNA polymerase sigma factor (sigma-70 family)